MLGTIMRRILLARHGETDWNAQGMLQGHTDIPLNSVGRAQARSLAEALGELDVRAVWTSDLARARETGVIVADVLGVGQPRVAVELRERGFGVFEGLTRAQCEEGYPEAWRAWQAHSAPPPGGESSEHVVARMYDALTRISAQAEGPTLVVSHGGIMRLWLSAVLGQPLALIRNGDTWAVELRAEGFAVERVVEGAAPKPPTRPTR